jgi:hypothetical protein
MNILKWASAIELEAIRHRGPSGGRKVHKSPGLLSATCRNCLGKVDDFEDETKCSLCGFTGEIDRDGRPSPKRKKDLFLNL